MYSIDCKYYTKEFKTLESLLDDIRDSGQDPNYMITLNGESTEEEAINLITN
jgi:hypothetical protein